MTLKSIFAFLIAAVGIGQAADAATYNARYIETRYGGANIFEYSEEPGTDALVRFASLSSRNDRWGLETLVPGLETGDVLSFGAIGLGCAVGPMTCDRNLESYYGFFRNDPLYFGGEYFYVRLDGEIAAGTTIEIWDIEAYHGHIFKGDGFEAHVRNRNTYFEIVSVAPVPLPATAALLPMGIGGLAMLRRRKARAGATRTARTDPR